MGRPKADIDPREIIRLSSKGWKVTEIADYFDVSRETIHNRFSTELKKGRLELKGTLRETVLEAAKRGNTALLMMLGRQYLGFTDTALDEHLENAMEQAGLDLEDVIELLKNKDKIEASRGKKPFHDFCITSGYPPPFAKQLEVQDFAFKRTVVRLYLGSRGYGKTDYITILGIAYQIYLDPEAFSSLIITKSDDRNKAILGEITAACEKNGVSFDRCNSRYLRARGIHGKDPSVSAVTIRTTSLRGRHPKLVVMDDPVTDDDTSEATRALAEKKYYEVVKLTSNVLIIGQPAHKYDLYAKLRGIVETIEHPHGTIPELDHDLEAQRLAGVSEESISASYFLKVLTEGTAPFDKVKYLDRFPVGESAVAFIDPSEGGDYTALTILKSHMSGVAVFGKVWKRAWNHCLDEMAPHLARLNVKKLCFETNCTGDQPIEMLRGIWPGIGIVGRRSNNNKHSRIMAAGAFAHLIHLSKESDKLYLDHVVKYEYKSKFDDAPDSLATCLEWVGLVRGKK